MGVLQETSCNSQWPVIGKALEMPAANIDELEEVYQQQVEFLAGIYGRLLRHKGMQCVWLWCATLVCHRKKQAKLLSKDCFTEDDQNVSTCFGHTCMGRRWWVRKMFVCWTQWPKLPCSILSEFFAQQMAPCQQPWLADPRQDDSITFWFLKFAPFTSNHWEHRRVSLFCFPSEVHSTDTTCASFFPLNNWTTQVRFTNQVVYTWVSRILLAVNPFEVGPVVGFSWLFMSSAKRSQTP